MTIGERALLHVALFLATVAVAILAGTLWPPAPVFVGIGWGWCLRDVDRWARRAG